MKSFIVDKNNEGQRLNKYCGRILPNAPQSFIYKMLRKKNITLNSKKADGSELINAGDEIKFFLSDETFARFAAAESLSQINCSVKLTRQSDNSDYNYQSSNKEFISPDSTKSISGNVYKSVTISDASIIFENEDILLVFKKPGELSQKADKNDISINEKIVNYINGKSEKIDTTVAFTPGICNRLDRNTQGIITAGKTLRGQRFLSELFRSRRIDKYYLAIVSGSLNEKIDQKLYLIKDEKSNRVSVSKKYTEGAEVIHNVFCPIASNGRITLVKVKLETGKSHQIRAHLAYLDHPIIGDTKYCKKDGVYEKKLAEKYRLSYQMLLAYELAFPNELTDFKELEGKSFCCRLPNEFIKICKGENLWHGNPEDLEVHFSSRL